MEVTEKEPSGVNENPPIVGMVFFLAVSGCVALAGGALVSIGHRLLGGEIRTTVLVAATIAGFLVSTAGWLVVIRGFTKAPDRMLGYYGGGVLAKTLLFGLTVAVVIGLKIASLGEFLTPFAAVFFLTGFAQLFIAIKGATKLLNEAEAGRVWEQPAAPGVARSPEVSEKDATEGS